MRGTLIFTPSPRKSRWTPSIKNCTLSTVENAVAVTGVTSFEIAEEDNDDDGKAVKVVLSAVPATADWVGGATGDVNATASWVCRNAGGDLLENVLPDERTEVRFAGEFAARW